MAEIYDVYETLDSLKREMEQASDPKVVAIHAFEGLGTVLLEVLRELRDIKTLVAQLDTGHDA